MPLKTDLLSEGTLRAVCNVKLIYDSKEPTSRQEPARDGSVYGLEIRYGVTSVQERMSTGSEMTLYADE